MNVKDFHTFLLGLYCFIVTLLLFLITLFARHEIFPIFQYGFGLDGEGNIYVGSTYDIFVYNFSGEKINQFPAIYTKYLMTVYDEKIFVKGTEHCLVLDFNGNVLDEIETTSYGANHLPSFSRYKYCSKDGTVYELRNIILRPQIIQEVQGFNVQLWKLPLNEYLTRIFLLVITVSDILSAFILFYRIGLIDKKGNVIW